MKKIFLMLCLCFGSANAGKYRLLEFLDAVDHEISGISEDSEINFRSNIKKSIGRLMTSIDSKMYDEFYSSFFELLQKNLATQDGKKMTKAECEDVINKWEQSDYLDNFLEFFTAGSLVSRILNQVSDFFLSKRTIRSFELQVSFSSELFETPREQLLSIMTVVQKKISDDKTVSYHDFLNDVNESLDKKFSKEFLDNLHWSQFSEHIKNLKTTEFIEITRNMNYSKKLTVSDCGRIVDGAKEKTVRDNLCSEENNIMDMVSTVSRKVKNLPYTEDVSNKFIIAFRNQTAEMVLKAIPAKQKECLEAFFSRC